MNKKNGIWLIVLLGALWLLVAGCDATPQAQPAPIPPAGPDCPICSGPDLEPCGDHGVCVHGVCWQWCGGGGFGTPACAAYPRGDGACEADVCTYLGLPPCALT